MGCPEGSLRLRNESIDVLEADEAPPRREWPALESYEVHIVPFNEHPVVGRVFAYMRARLAEAIGLQEVARALGYSPSYLTALVRQVTGQPVMQWLIALRLEEGRRLLADPDRSIAEVAMAVGIPDARYFTRLFKRAYGQPPQIWRARGGR